MVKLAWVYSENYLLSWDQIRLKIDYAFVINDVESQESQVNVSLNS